MLEIKYQDWTIENVCGYKPQTTAYMDLGIAENFGAKVIEDTYKRLKKEFKGDCKKITELTMALNWKIHEHFYKGNKNYSVLYDTLWKEMDAWCVDNFKGDDLSYYYRTTD